MSPFARFPGRCVVCCLRPALAVLAALVLNAGAARAATFTVDRTGDGSVGACTAAANDCSLRGAIATANAAAGADSIAFDATVFAPSGPHIITLNAALPNLSGNLQLNGPGAGVLTVQRNTAAGTPEFRIFTVSNGTPSGPTATIAGLTIGNGRVAGGTFPAAAGGGILNDHGMLTVQNCTLNDNNATLGGAICNYSRNTGSATLAVINGTFVANLGNHNYNGNFVTGSGGGIFNDGSSGGNATLTVQDSAFQGNSAFYGGGINNNGSGGGKATLTLTHSTLKGNLAPYGAGIRNDGSANGRATLTLTDSTLTTGNSSAGNGGGIDNDAHGTGSTALTLQGCTLEGNRSFHGGGGINSQVSSGVAGDVNGSATLTLSNCTLSANGADSGGSSAVGGGINNDGSHGVSILNLTHCTLSGNFSSGQAAGLYNGADSGTATLAIGHTILANEGAGNLVNGAGGIVTSQGYNLCSDDGGGALTGSGDQINTAAQLDPAGLQDHGGPTQTIALLAGSPAINGGNPGFAPPPTTDQRGLPRVAGGRLDIGAFESAFTGSLVVTITADEDDADLSPNDIALREAINLANARPGADTISFAPGVTGAIVLSQGVLTLASDVTINGPPIAPGITVDGNEAGSVFFVPSGTATLSRLTIARGNADGNFEGGFGGGVTVVDGATLNLNDCTLSGNHADNGLGGGGLSNSGTASLSNCTLSGNHADDSYGGGGILNFGALTLNSCTLSGNHANGSRALGGGLSAGDINPSIANTIIAGNTADSGPDVAGLVASQGFNLIGDGSDSSGFSETGDQVGEGGARVIEANLGPLQNNGGPTPTHALLVDSPAIDQGNSFGATTDQRGRVRPFDQPGIAPERGGDNSDIGAYERQAVALSIGDVTVTEGNSGTANAVFKVTLAEASTQTVTVHYATQNGTATTPTDYTAVPATVLTFNPGQTSKNVPVAIKGDALDEANETFKVTLSSPVNATIADGQGIGTISDDDPTPRVFIDDVTVAEGNPASFHLSLSAASGRTVTVIYKTADGTATAGADYIAHPSTTLTFTPGQTSKTIIVQIKGDAIDEANETFKVLLQSATFAAIVDDQGAGTITDNDPLPSLAISDAPSLHEGNAGLHNALFTVTLTPASGRTVTVNYATANGTATSGSDYTAATGTLTFLPGQTSKTLPIQVKGDVTVEPDESFKVNLSGASFATIADSQGSHTIVNDDASE